MDSQNFPAENVPFMSSQARLWGELTSPCIAVQKESEGNDFFKMLCPNKSENFQINKWLSLLGKKLEFSHRQLGDKISEFRKIQEDT